VKERPAVRRRIAEFQAPDKLADMATKIELARLMTYKAAGIRPGRIDPSSLHGKMYARARRWRGG